MKNVTAFICFLFYISLSAQSDSNIQGSLSINPTGAGPAASAILDVQSDSKGILVPRLTTAQRNNITSPSTGLLVFDIDTGSFWYHSSGNWTEIPASTAIPAGPAGGDLNGTYPNPVLGFGVVDSLNLAIGAVTSSRIRNGTILSSDLNSMGATNGQVLTWDGGWLPKSVSTFQDNDGNTKIQVEESPDENRIRFDAAGSQAMIIDNNGNVGINENNPEFKLTVGAGSGIPVIGVGGSSLNQGEGGRLAFDEDVNDGGGVCGFEFQHDGTLNMLKLVSGCYITGGSPVLMLARRDNALINFPGRVRIGDELTPSADLHIKQTNEPSTSPSIGGIILEESTTTDKWQIWNSNDNLSFARNGTRVAYIDTGGNFNTTSDRRVKRNIRSLDDVLDKVMHLNPVAYSYKYQEEDAKPSFGFIAQEVLPYFPETVDTRNESQYALSYQDFSVIAIKAIQEQQEMIRDLQQEVEALRAEVRLRAMGASKD